ncbi:MAG: insulinase family protein [Candidatus Poribacteria bacterium]|nr:insulinase family protein [Candidatus Poribacteria bacterium]
MDSKLAADSGGSSRPPVDLQQGKKLHGFEVKAITPIEELRAVAIELLHPHSGARLLHLWTDDSRNLFSISPITPTYDDTGLPHILEHCVTMGSRKYPVKGVLFESMKMSLASYDSTNAMNCVDHGFYYTSNNVRKDLFNIAEIHFDSVFHPLLTEETFKREAHHLEPIDLDQPTENLKINGIVYNEVKMGLTDPEYCLWTTVKNNLLPDTHYTNNGAGNPLVIPDLTYEKLKFYHETYYHPHNSYFFFYGDIPTHEYLSFLSDKLERMPKTQTNGRQHPLRKETTRQSKWKSPRIVTDTYPIGTDESLNEKTYLMLSWLIGDATDPEEAIMFRLLLRILLGNESSPLRKAITNVKLGINIRYNFLGGRMGPNRTWSIGLVGSEADRVEPFVELVMNTLTQIANADINQEQVEAAFQQITYDYQEVTSNFPFQMAMRVFNTWIYEKDPTLFLKMGVHLSAVRQRWEQNPQIFNELIRERLLDNPHRLTTILKPAPGKLASLYAKENERLKAIRAQLSDEQLRQIAVDAIELENLSGKPNSPADLAKLPQLRVSDLHDKPLQIPTTVETVKGCPLLRNDIFSNGVNYLTLNFDLQGLPQHLWQYLSCYTDAISKLGAGKMNYEQIAQRRAAATGGIGCSPTFTTHAHGPDHTVFGVRFELKALDGKIADALNVIHDLIFNVNPRDKKRFREILKRAVTSKQDYYWPHAANHRAANRLSIRGYLKDIVYGLPRLRTNEMLLNSFDDSYEELACNIEKIRNFLLSQCRVTASFTGTDTAFAMFRGQLTNWIDEMRPEPILPTPINFQSFQTPPRDGLAAPIPIAHCTKIIPAPHYSHSDSVLLTIGSHIIRNDYMRPEIRLKGNAYGFAFSYNPFESLIYQGSERDPHIARTLNVFANTIDYVKQTEWTQTDIDRAIIAKSSDYLQTVRPSQASTDAIWHYVKGQTREVVEEKYAQLRRATPKEVKRALLQVLEENQDKAPICVIASREKLEAENQKMDQPLEIEDI